MTNHAIFGQFCAFSVNFSPYPFVDVHIAPAPHPHPPPNTCVDVINGWPLAGLLEFCRCCLRVLGVERARLWSWKTSSSINVSVCRDSTTTERSLSFRRTASLNSCRTDSTHTSSHSSGLSRSLNATHTAVSITWSRSALSRGGEGVGLPRRVHGQGQHCHGLGEAGGACRVEYMVKVSAMFRLPESTFCAIALPISLHPGTYQTSWHIPDIPAHTRHTYTYQTSWHIVWLWLGILWNDCTHISSHSDLHDIWLWNGKVNAAGCRRKRWWTGLCASKNVCDV